MRDVFNFSQIFSHDSIVDGNVNYQDLILTINRRIDRRLWK